MSNAETSPAHAELIREALEAESARAAFAEEAREHLAHLTDRRDAVLRQLADGGMGIAEIGTALNLAPQVVYKAAAAQGARA